MMDILPEPVSKWMDLNGTDMLQLIYDDPERWSMAQVSFNQINYHNEVKIILEENNSYSHKYLLHKEVISSMKFV